MRTMLRSKIHRARVTDCNLEYEGSITIDRELLAAADILPNEKVDVLNVNNGERFSTYTMPGEAGSGTICINGAAARLAAKNDIIIILTYCDLTDEAARNHVPRVVLLDENNSIKSNAGK